MFTPEAIAFIREFGFPIFVLVVIIGTGARKIWVWGRELSSSEKRESEWREIALRALGVAERKDKLRDE